MLLKDFEDPFEASWNSQEVVIEEILEEGRDGSNRNKQRCRTETILNTKHRTTQSQGQARMTAGHGRQRSPARPRRRKNKGQDPKRISAGPSGLLLLQKQPLTYIFRTPSFHERSPQPPKQEQRPKDINNTAGEGFPFRLRQPISALSIPLQPIPHPESRGRVKREPMGGASFVVPPLSSNDWLWTWESPPSGSAPARGPWQPIAPEEGGRRWRPLPCGGRES